MALTTDSIVLVNNPQRYVVQLMASASAADNETAAQKVNKSALTGTDGSEPLAIDINRIEWAINTYAVTLLWDHATDDEAIRLGPGTGFIDYRERYGPLKDPTLNDSTGDIVLTSTLGAAGANYTILLDLSLRS